MTRSARGGQHDTHAGSHLVVYLVRHGRTALNADGALRGRLDPDLDEVGHSEVHALAEAFREVPISRIFSSPLLRARRTAEAIATMTGLDVEIADAWTDRDYGPWSGHSAEEVRARFGSIDAAPGVEERAHFEARVLEAARQLAASAAPGSVTVVVSHDAVLRTVLARLVADLPDGPDTLEQSTACWNRLEVSGGSWRATEINAPPGTAPEGDGGEASKTAPASPSKRGWLSRGVASVGLTSFLSDSGHEITTAVLPSFLTAVLHGSAASLGVIEGVSDALTGVTKLVGGPLSNDARRRARLATCGYLGTAAATGAIGLAATIWQAGMLRAAAWSSRGLRSPARDSLLASLADDRSYGRAFGLERAGDNLGAVVGPLLAAGLVTWVGIRYALYFAFVPGLLAAFAIAVAARESRRRGEPVGGRVRLQFRGLRDAGVVRAMLPIGAFEFGNVATTILILRATQLLHVGGRPLAAATTLAILIYAGHNAFGAVLAYGGGHWIDRAGPRVVFAAGAALYVLAYAGFSIGPHSWWGLLIAFILAGSGIGLSETAESVLVARSLPDRQRGSGFGLLGGVQAAGDLVSTVVVGVLYATVSPMAGFAYAAAWMVLCLIATFGSRLMVPRPAN